MCDHRDTVRIVDEAPLDELLPEIRVSIQRSYQTSSLIRDTQRAQGISAMHESAHDSHADAKAKVWRDRCRAKLNLVKHRVHAFARQAISRDLLHGLEDALLHLGHVFFSNALQANGQGGLPPTAPVARARGEAGAPAGLDQGLVEDRLGAVQEQIGRNGQREAVQGVPLGDLVHQQPGRGHDALLGRVCNHRVGRHRGLHPLRLRVAHLVLHVQTSHIQRAEGAES
mmetsp:Transcript_110/g.183  ORF Transcript_110/g.183 Transcript_110/m.183 type:complete len:227 (-) Transcript_110:1096-1776(-)